MAIVGHPKIAGGHDIPEVAEGGDVANSSARFAALYQLLAKHNVRIAVAGDTHDFEYPIVSVSADTELNFNGRIERYRMAGGVSV